MKRSHRAFLASFAAVLLCVLASWTRARAALPDPRGPLASAASICGTGPTSADRREIALLFEMDGIATHIFFNCGAHYEKQPDGTYKALPTFDPSYKATLFGQHEAFEISPSSIAFAVHLGSLSGTFERTIPFSRLNDVQYSSADVVRTLPDGSVVVNRQFQEIFLVYAVEDGLSWGDHSRFVLRLVAELDGSGQPVMDNGGGDSLVDPDAVAAAFGGARETYLTGVHVFRSEAASQRNCILRGSIPAADCLKVAGPTQKRLRKDDFANGFLSLVFLSQMAFTAGHRPTSDPATWTQNRTDFTEVLGDLVLNGAFAGDVRIPANVLDQWAQEAITAIMAP